MTAAPAAAAPATPDRAFSRRLDLTSLQLYVAVCEQGSIGRAAEQEFIAASAVSKRLSDLEATVGAPLLERHSRGVRLTAAGEALLHHARSLLYGLERMQSELQDYAGGVRGHVRVHANISAIVQYLPEDLGRFCRAWPAVKIDLEEHLSGDVLDAVRAGAADLGICRIGDNARTAAHGLECRAYRPDQLVLVVPQGHPLAARGAIAFADALDCDMVSLSAASSLGTAMQQAAAAAGRALKLRIRVGGLDAVCRMIDNGLGVGMLPARAFALLVGGARLVAVPLTDAWAQRELQLVARDFAALPASARLLVEHLAPAPAPASAPGP